MFTKNKYKVLVTGGCGYTGSIISENLANKGYKVVIIDTLWFGNKLKKNSNIKVVKKDISSVSLKDLKNVHSVIHLANIANDPSVKLNPLLSWEVNVLATDRLIQLCIKAKVKKFIYASSGSVYGIKKEKKVTENLLPVPISTYNKTKMIAERVLQSYQNKIKIHSIRPATVCGYSPRMRLDVSVNMFIYQALVKKKLIVLGGKQIRPNINIKDLRSVFIHFIKNPQLENGNYNAGFENLKILDVAKLVKKHIPAKILIKKDVNDPRSYRQNSDKLLKTGFRPLFSVEDAIIEIKEKFQNKKILIDDKCHTVKWMKKRNIK